MNTAPKQQLRERLISANEHLIGAAEHHAAIAEAIAALAPPSGEGVEEVLAFLEKEIAATGAQSYDPTAAGLMRTQSLIRRLTTPQSAPVDGDTPQAQIDRLASFILQEIPGEPSQDQGAVDTAIRLLRTTPPPASQERGGNDPDGTLAVELRVATETQRLAAVSGSSPPSSAAHPHG